MNYCRPYRFVHPLRGCVNTRGNAIGYRYASPDGDEGRNNQHFGARHVSATTPPQCADATTTLHSPLSTLHSSHTFSAKERDSETGLSYFGARYYSSDLSIWLSVDPMSDKYPSLSPYVYCADNPVKLVDPDGEEYEVFIISDDEQTANKAFKQLQSSTNLILERGKDGRITIIGGEVRNDNDMLLKKAINDKSIIVEINAINGTSDDYVIGGAFMGNNVVDKETPLYGAKPYNVIALMFSRYVYTKQTVDPYETEILDEIGYDHYVPNGPKIKAYPGQTILHEVTESYCGGVDALFSGISAGNATVSPSAYKSAHNAATYQPDILMDIPDVLNIFRERRGK